MDLDGRKVLVVGLARTGLATADFLKGRGAAVSATEARPREEMKEAVRATEAMDIPVEWGGHQTETFLGPDLIVVSPGVDLGMRPIQEASRKGIPILSEIELASRFIRAPIIAVSGTNGKTTTTLLIGEMLKEEGRRVGVGGNVGEPLVLFAGPEATWDVLVVEISSFQLEAIETFRPRLSVLLNITEDHLDRHPSYQAYVEAKARLFANQTSEDQTVLNGDDPIVVRLARRIRPKKFFFSLEKRVEEGAFSDGDVITLRLGGREDRFPLSKARLKGIHNVENMMAALTAAGLFGCSKRSMAQTLGRFEGLEHRLEFVREIEGVRYFNDSKGTNVGSVVKSLQSFPDSIILIAGGKDKRGDLSPLKELIRNRVKHLILIGEAKERMARELGTVTKATEARTLEDAVSIARRNARPGDVVLLSPACSSFDMFQDYRARGKAFKEAVSRIGAAS